MTVPDTKKRRKTIDQRLLRIEEILGHAVPGTSLTRVVADRSFLLKENKDWALLSKQTSGSSEMQEDTVLAWCLSLGGLMSPKKFLYGRTVEEVVSSAEQYLGVAQ